MPPRWLEGFIRLLLPPACREHVLGDLSERYKSPASYAVETLSVLPPIVISRIRRTTDFQVFVMEAMATYLSFTIAAWFLGQQDFLYHHAGFARLGLPTAVTVIALLFCNAYSDPQRRSVAKPILQSAGSISLAFLGQAVVFDTHRSLAVPFQIMLYGSLLSVVFVSALQTIHSMRSHQPPRI